MGDKRRVSENVKSDRKAISDCANAFSTLKKTLLSCQVGIIGAHT